MYYASMTSVSMVLANNCVKTIDTDIGHRGERPIRFAIHILLDNDFDRTCASGFMWSWLRDQSSRIDTLNTITTKIRLS